MCVSVFSFVILWIESINSIWFPLSGRNFGAYSLAMLTNVIEFLDVVFLSKKYDWSSISQRLNLHILVICFYIDLCIVHLP